METTFLLIRCERGYERGVIEKLKGLQGISDCRETIGMFDLIAKLDHADEALAYAILRMPEVRQVKPLICHQSIPKMLIEIAQ
jgi:DNA-binding Lrp family transcriptional regulator